jgi:catechol 2,3-dioxygenase-like lactoylglutathione lyase family enzyme
MTAPSPDGRPFSVVELDHVVLRVRDQAVSERFYRDVLGFALDHVNEPIRLVQLRGGRHLIDLLPLRTEEGEAPAPDARMDHLCLAVRSDDLEGARRWLLAQGVTVDGEVAQRRGAFGHGPSIYIRDPDGYRIELKLQSPS